VLLRPGDYVVIATDGAAKGAAEAGTEHLESWRFALALERLLEGSPPPALIAARLCWRAEELGGTDNATVLILRIEQAAPQRDATAAERLATRLRRIVRAASEIVST
jgi:serine phosphatase RsbU (regulator of sigma subunit)